jgi:hypothetical protein
VPAAERLAWNKHLFGYADTPAEPPGVEIGLELARLLAALFLLRPVSRNYGGQTGRILLGTKPRVKTPTPQGYVVAGYVAMLCHKARARRSVAKEAWAKFYRACGMEIRPGRLTTHR